MTEPDVIDDVTEPNVIEPEAIEPDVIEPDVIDQAAAETAPIVMGPAAVEAVTDTDDLERAVDTEREEPTRVASVAGRRSFSRRLQGGTGERRVARGGLRAGCSWAVHGAARRHPNAFGYSWSGDIVAVVLVLALLTPLFAFRRGWHVPGVLAGTAVGYMAYTPGCPTPRGSGGRTIPSPPT